MSNGDRTMKSKLVVRSSDSPLVHSVSHWTIGNEENILAFPDGLWDLVVFKQEGRVSLFLTGQTSRAVPLPFAAGDEILTISFKASTFLPFLPATQLLDTAEILETNGRRFQLGWDNLEIPKFDNAEDLVRLLQKRDVIQSDELVSSYLSGHPMAASLRSVQRHFLAVTGMSPRKFFLIERARSAVALLQTGLSASQVAVDAGYSDQPHLCRSLKAIMGQTPLQIQQTP